MPPTEALYLDNAALHTTTTQLISCQPVSNLDDDSKRLAKNIAPEEFALITRQTVFYAQGGGQPSDTGVITASPQNGSVGGDADADAVSKFEVLLVRKTVDGTIFHFGRFLAPGLGSIPAQPPSFAAPGQTLSLSIDRSKRNYHSRLHTAGHIIGLAMRLLSPVLGDRKKVKANHAPGEACMEFEGLLYNEHKPAIQEKVDELARQQLPVRISWWGEAEIEARMDELDMVEGRQVGGMGRIRIAEIGDIDANPCGGTHVDHTGLTGPITIRKIGRQKGISRISYEVPADLV